MKITAIYDKLNFTVFLIFLDEMSDDWMKMTRDSIGRIVEVSQDGGGEEDQLFTNHRNENKEPQQWPFLFWLYLKTLGLYHSGKIQVLN